VLAGYGSDSGDEWSRVALYVATSFPKGSDLTILAGSQPSCTVLLV
jgi:hypothetical protein